MGSLKAILAHPLHELNVPATVMRNDGSSEPVFHGALCGTLGERVVILSGVGGMPFRVGDSLIIHTNLRNHAIGFVTSVLAIAKKPAPHYYLTFPEGYENLELRKGIRLPTLIPVTIETVDEVAVEAGATLSVNGAVINLSRNGCAVSAREAFGEHQTLRLCLDLPGRPGTYRLDITVVKRSAKAELNVHGARFIHGPETDATLQAVAQWVETQSRYSPIDPTAN